MKRVPLLLVAIVVTASTVFSQPTPAPKATPSASPKSETSSSRPTIVLPPEKTQPDRMPRFDKPPVIDGKLDDEIWKQAALLKDF